MINEENNLKLYPLTFKIDQRRKRKYNNGLWRPGDSAFNKKWQEMLDEIIFDAITCQANRIKV